MTNLRRTIFLVGLCLFLAFMPESLTAQIHYPWPSRSWKAEPVVKCERWFFNSSYMNRPFGAEVGIFNYNPVTDTTSTKDNILTWSTGFSFPIVGGSKYCRDQVVKYTQFIGRDYSLNGVDDSRAKGYQFMSASSWDLIGWRFMELSAVYGFSFGQRKITSTINDEKVKFKNPFIGALAGMDFRINILGFFDTGISLGGYCYYMYDFTKAKWNYRADQEILNLPNGVSKMSGLQFGVGIHYVFAYDDQTYVGTPYY